MNFEREISRNIPSNLPKHYLKHGIPILTAYGCILFERDTGGSFIYTAINLDSGRTEILSRRTYPLTTSGVETMIEKLRRSSVVGAGRLEAERLFGEKIALAKCRETMLAIFNEILPLHGYNVRAEQVSLAEHILDAISRRHISLAEAEVGTGKTLAYLIPAILAKRGRLNDFWNMGLYAVPYVKTAHMPIVIATSSIALQKAIVTDYIPELSRILMTHGIVKTPLTAVIRKGREHYICERNLRSHIFFEHNQKMKSILNELLEPRAPIDIAEIEYITPHVKRKISVPIRCYDNCPFRDGCAYLHFREQAGSAVIDIQVCNHNYLLADTLRRADDERPLIPNYQILIIDEAHKFLSAARSMYGIELSYLMFPNVKDKMFTLELRNKAAEKLSRKMVRKLCTEGERLFRSLTSNNAEDKSRYTAVINADSARHIRNISDMSEYLIEMLSYETAIDSNAGRKSQIMWDLKQISDKIKPYIKHNELICWIESDKGEESLCSIPKNLDKRLHNDLWSKSIPTILTSGTLSANQDFSRIRRSLGLDYASLRLTETSKSSPFDYRKNSLLYISENVPFPDQRNKEYIAAVTDEIEKLILASHGHAAVLFTSYKVMDMVWEKLKTRGLPFPMFRLDKGGIREIERFKQSKNGVLFASGAVWEGIDIPGDTLSMLIIVKLPFAVPDPISEYERTLYENMAEYIWQVIVPDMLIKLKQGHGRLIRLVTDTGVVALLDIRAGVNGVYRLPVLEALPDCVVTDKLSDVEAFYLAVKAPEYFEKDNLFPTWE